MPNGGVPITLWYQVSRIDRGGCLIVPSGKRKVLKLHNRSLSFALSYARSVVLVFGGKCVESCFTAR